MNATSKPARGRFWLGVLVGVLAMVAFDYLSAAYSGYTQAVAVAAAETPTAAVAPAAAPFEPVPACLDEIQYRLHQLDPSVVRIEHTGQPTMTSAMAIWEHDQRIKVMHQGGRTDSVEGSCVFDAGSGYVVALTVDGVKIK